MYENKNCSLAVNSGFRDTLQELKHFRREEAFLFGEASYEAGMRFVIKEMARSQHLNGRGLKDHEWRTEDIRSAKEKIKSLLSELKETLNEEQYEKVVELDDALTLEASFNEELQYVNGFWQGYKYVRSLE